MTPIVPFVPKPAPDFEESFGDLTATCDAVRVQIATVDSIAVAYRLWQQLRALSEELVRLTDQAAERCEALLDRL